METYITFFGIPTMLVASLSCMFFTNLGRKYVMEKVSDNIFVMILSTLGIAYFGITFAIIFTFTLPLVFMFFVLNDAQITIKFPKLENREVESNNYINPPPSPTNDEDNKEDNDDALSDKENCECGECVCGSPSQSDYETKPVETVRPVSPVKAEDNHEATTEKTPLVST